ncbi:hypothetical protein O181_020065 [Austropuccinia psidii MF-1]|uniref:Peptidase A2 domain-containing protein n=1 Tax=Austropuccinia psidii MF-1 TaxID=1389203 RepID=A0A9Q3CBW7_9BASI|nr:hypothetical protein [Austropuccinia psidii MF-1]
MQEEKEEERVIIPTEFQNSSIPKPDQPEEEIENIANKNEEKEIPKEEKKFRKPSKKEREKIKQLNSMDLQKRLLTFVFKEISKPKIHYASPLGFIEIFIGKEEYPIRALVDTGAELNIIPEEIAIKSSLTTRNLNMNLRGIAGHTTSLVALSEFTPIIFASGIETQIHFFIEKGSVHKVLGRPLLADNKIRVELSHKQGEILSYQEPDGR